MFKKLRAVVLFTMLMFISLCVPFETPAQTSLAGHWEGAITQPAGELKILVDFTSTADNIKGTFDLPDAAVFHWPLNVDYASPKVKFRLPTGLLFEGEVQGDTISGKARISDKTRRHSPKLETTNGLRSRTRLTQSETAGLSRLWRT